MTTWVKVYNSMPQNPKVLMAGERAAWLFVCGLCYSNEHLTDGFIPRHSLPVVAPGVKGSEQLADKLVTAGLWHKEDGGWRIHDYGDTQRTAAEIRERRDKDRQRKAAARGVSDEIPRGQTADSTQNPGGVDAESARIDVDVEGREQKAEGNISSSGAPRADGDEKATEDDIRLCRLLGELAKERNPKFKVKSRSRWLTDMRLLRERDKNDPAEIERAVRWVFADDFWGGVIQSPGNLREHFPAIWDRMTRSNVVPLRQRETASDWLRDMDLVGDRGMPVVDADVVEEEAS